MSGCTSCYCMACAGCTYDCGCSAEQQASAEAEYDRKETERKRARDPDVLRAQLAAMTKERDEARDEAITDSLVRNGLAEDMRQELCAAVARAEKAEAELVVLKKEFDDEVEASETRDGQNAQECHRLFRERDALRAELARAQALLADVEEVAQLARDVCVDLVRLDELETALGYGPDRDADRWVYTPPHASEHAGEIVTVLGRGYHKELLGFLASGDWAESVRYIDAQGTHRSRPVDEFNALFVKQGAKS